MLLEAVLLLPVQVLRADVGEAGAPGVHTSAVGRGIHAIASIGSVVPVANLKPTEGRRGSSGRLPSYRRPLPPIPSTAALTVTAGIG